MNIIPHLHDKVNMIIMCVSASGIILSSSLVSIVADEKRSSWRKRLFGRSVALINTEFGANSCDGSRGADRRCCAGAGRNAEGGLDRRGHVQK